MAHAGEKRAHDGAAKEELSAKKARAEPPSVPHASSGVLVPYLPAPTPMQQLTAPAPASTMVPAPPSASADEAAVEAFLRAMQPPLEQLDVALSAIRGSGVTMAHLRRAAGRDVLIAAVASALRITRPFDRLAFAAALLDLHCRSRRRAARLVAACCRRRDRPRLHTEHVPRRLTHINAHARVPKRRCIGDLRLLAAEQVQRRRFVLLLLQLSSLRPLPSLTSTTSFFNVCAGIVRRCVCASPILARCQCLRCCCCCDALHGALQPDRRR